MGLLAAVAVVGVTLAAISYVRGNSWKHRAHAAEGYQNQVEHKLSRSEADVKNLEGKLATLANANAKSGDYKQYAEAILASVSRLSDQADTLDTDSAACADAVDGIAQSLDTGDPNAKIDPKAVSGALTRAKAACSSLNGEVSDLQDLIDEIGD